MTFPNIKSYYNDEDNLTNNAGQSQVPQSLVVAPMLWDLLICLLGYFDSIPNSCSASCDRFFSDCTRYFVIGASKYLWFSNFRGTTIFYDTPHIDSQPTRLIVPPIFSNLVMIFDDQK